MESEECFRPGGQNSNEEHWKGTRVFRRWMEIPEKINGYATQGSRVMLDLAIRQSETD